VHEQRLHLVSSSPIERTMNSRTPLIIQNTAGIREGMGQFHGTIPSQLIKELIEATRERRRRQSGFASWRSLCIAHKSVKEVEKNGCRRRLRGKCKQQLVP